MVKKVNSDIASKEEFVDRHNGVIQSIIPKSIRKYNSYTTFEFNDKYVARLPFCDTTGGIDLYDRTTTIDEHGKEVTAAILVLRIQKRTKTFYFRYKNKMHSSLGRWTGDTSKSHYTKDEACVRIARERMAKEVRLIESRDSSVAHIAEWTIEDYINKRYSQDREKYTIQRGEIKSVTERTKNDIIRDLGDYKHKRIKDVEKSWIEPLIKEWKRPKLNKANGRVLAKAKVTCKKAYTEINAMFNICVKAGYIAINPLRDEMWRFKEENTSEKEINIIDEDPDTLLRFIFEVAPGSMQGKMLLATMCMAGMRNHEVYRNFTKNFRIKKQEIFVPGAISGKHKKDRTIPVMNDYYWDRVKEYLSCKEYTSHINDAMHFLPMRRTQSEKVAKRNNYEPAHVTDGIKRPVWSAVKERFGLEEGFQPYDFRHTFITQLVENMDIHEVVKYSGNSKEMVIRHYASVNKEKSRPKFAKIQNRKKGKTEQEEVTQEQSQSSNVY